MNANLAVTPHTDHVGRDVLAYVLIAYGFTWLCHLAIPALGVPFAIDHLGPAMVLYMIGLLGPLISAITVSAYRGGPRAVAALLGRVLRWRFGWPWYLMAIGTVPAICMADLLLFHDRLQPGSPWFVFPLLPIVGQVWVVMGEEFGWRGFVLPRLQTRLGSLGAALALGVIWSIWHLPMFFVPGSPQYSEHALAAFANYVFGMTCISVIMTLLFNRSGGSVLVGMLFHASMNIAAFVILVPRSADYTDYAIIAVAVLAALALPRPLFGHPAEKERK